MIYVIEYKSVVGEHGFNDTEREKEHVRMKEVQEMKVFQMEVSLQE